MEELQVVGVVRLSGGVPEGVWVRVGSTGVGVSVDPAPPPLGVEDVQEEGLGD